MIHPDADAFPFVLHGAGGTEYSHGLTKREYFAAMAMQGLCANGIPGSQHGFKSLTAEAVMYADWLIDTLNSPVKP